MIVTLFSKIMYYLSSEIDIICFFLIEEKIKMKKTKFMLL